MPEKRYDTHGMMVLMSEADGYVMARRPGYAPFVRTRKEWDRLPKEPVKAPAAGGRDGT